jgi:hypothetical protein
MYGIYVEIFWHLLTYDFEGSYIFCNTYEVSILAGLWFHMILLNCCTWRPSSCIRNLCKLVHILCWILTTLDLLYISWNFSQNIFFFLTYCCWLSKLWSHISVGASVHCQYEPLEDIYRNLYTSVRCVLPWAIIFSTYFCMWDFRFSWQEPWRLVLSWMSCCVAW